MSYIALYRKWRPKTFDEVRGQEVATKALKNQIIANHIAHAYLFTGTRGTGKTSVAKIMARAVNCTNPKNGNPCNECEACKSILKDASISVVELDAATNNGIDDIRIIKEQITYPPTDVKYKVFIIDEAHMLSKAAANALLKTLEEPPEYAIFILATTDVHRLPVTVCSRCQRYDFKRIKTQVIADRLREICDDENVDISDKAVYHIAISGDGALRDAISILDECRAFYPEQRIEYDDVLNVIGTIDSKIFGEILQNVSQRNINGIISIVNDLVYEGRDISQLVNDFIWYMRNMLIVKNGQDVTYLLDMTKDAIDSMYEVKDVVSKEQLIRYIGIFSELSNKIKFSSQKRILFELELIRLMTPSMDIDVESVLDRLSYLENSIREGSINVVDKKLNYEKNDNEEKVVELEKAVYDDYQVIKKDWNNIVNSLRNYIAALLSGVKPNISESGELIIAFKDNNKYQYFNKEDIIEEVKKELESRYNKEFNIKVVNDIKNEFSNIKYKLEDIIKNEFTIPVDVVLE